MDVAFNGSGLHLSKRMSAAIVASVRKDDHSLPVVASGSADVERQIDRVEQHGTVFGF